MGWVAKFAPKGCGGHSNALPFDIILRVRADEHILKLLRSPAPLGASQAARHNNGGGNRRQSDRNHRHRQSSGELHRSDSATNDMMTLDKDGTLEAVALTDGTLDKDGTLDAVALTDGTASITNGAISSVTTLTATTLTDGTASITGGKYTQRWRQQAGGYKLELSRV